MNLPGPDYYIGEHGEIRRKEPKPPRRKKDRRKQRKALKEQLNASR